MSTFKEIVETAVKNYATKSYKEVEKELQKDLMNSVQEKPRRKGDLENKFKMLLYAAAENREDNNEESKTAQTLRSLAENDDVNVLDAYMNLDYSMRWFGAKSSWTKELHEALKAILVKRNKQLEESIKKTADAKLKEIQKIDKETVAVDTLNDKIDEGLNAITRYMGELTENTYQQKLKKILWKRKTTALSNTEKLNMLSEIKTA